MNMRWGQCSLHIGSSKWGYGSVYQISVEKQVRRINRRLSYISQCHIYLFVRICWCCRRGSLYIVCVEKWYLHQRTGFELSGAPEPPCVIQIICCVSISGAPDTRIAKAFGIFTESTMLIIYSQLQKRMAVNFLTFLRQIQHSISLIIHGQKDSLSYIELMHCILRHSSHISCLSDEYSRVFPRTVMKFRHTSDLTPYAYSTANFDQPPLIINMRSHSRHASEPCIPTSHYPWVIHFAPFQAYFLPSWMRWICACQHTIFPTLNF
jgi:hypothetical protein